MLVSYNLKTESRKDSNKERETETVRVELQVSGERTDVKEGRKVCLGGNVPL